LFEVIKERARQLPAGGFFVIVSPQKGPAMMQILSWLNQHQMNPCHICINPETQGPFAAPVEGTRASEDWIKKIRAQGYMGYELSNLTELPNILGGAKRYAYGD
jgi:hypothetical protein